MEPDKKNRILFGVAQVVVIALGIFIIIAFSLTPKHTPLDYAGFGSSLLLVLAVLVQINNKKK